MRALYFWSWGLSWEETAAVSPESQKGHKEERKTLSLQGWSILGSRPSHSSTCWIRSLLQLHSSLTTSHFSSSHGKPTTNLHMWLQVTSPEHHPCPCLKRAPKHIGSTSVKAQWRPTHASPTPVLADSCFTPRQPECFLICCQSSASASHPVTILEA